jgi:hypothetical protein
MEEIIMEPKVVAILTGKKLYWCPSKRHQILEQLCKGKYFTKTGRGKHICRLCLGLSKGKHWPEPWASLGGAKW